MEINNESVSAYTKILKDPKTHGIPIRPLAECFQPTEVARPKHLLYEDYKEEIGNNLPKIFFYIVMDQEYPETIAKSPNGDLGYKLAFIPQNSAQNPEQCDATDAK